jgi:NAD(P)-dependent dehydrogenase (short-subunit alcohol dehydrogenase family)
VSVLVHNASGWHKDSFSPDRGDAVGRTSVMVNPKSIDSQLHIDARAGALLMAEFITRHRARNARWGRVVTLTSGEGKHFPGEVSYGAGKAALISYTLSAAAEMADSGVTANVVYPPVTDTGWITDEVRAFVANDFDHHHVAEPSEVAEVIGWLCGEAGPHRNRERHPAPVVIRSDGRHISTRRIPVSSSRHAPQNGPSRTPHKPELKRPEAPVPEWSLGESVERSVWVLRR